MTKTKSTENGKEPEFPNTFCVMGKHRYSEGAILDNCDYCGNVYHHQEPKNKKERERLEVLQATLTYIELYKERHGYAPSRREIMDSCCYSSTSQVNRFLRELERMDLIELGTGARAINVVGWEWRKSINPVPGPKPPDAHVLNCDCRECLMSLIEMYEMEDNNADGPPRSNKNEGV